MYIQTPKRIQRGFPMIGANQLRKTEGARGIHFALRCFPNQDLRAANKNSPFDRSRLSRSPTGERGGEFCYSRHLGRVSPSNGSKWGTCTMHRGHISANCSGKTRNARTDTALRGRTTLTRVGRAEGKNRLARLALMNAADVAARNIHFRRSFESV